MPTKLFYSALLGSPTYIPSASSLSLTTGFTYFGDMTANAGLAAAFDSTTSQSTTQSAGKASSTEAYAGVTFNEPTIVGAFQTYSSDNGGYNNTSNTTIDLTFYGKQGSTPANSTDGILLATVPQFTDTNTELNHYIEVDQAYRFIPWDHVWVRIVPGSSGSLRLGELYVYPTKVGGI